MNRMLGFMGTVLAAAILAPALTAAVAFTAGRRTPRLMGRLGALAALAGFVGTLLIAAGGDGAGAVSATLGPIPVTADRLAVVLLLLVFGVSAVVQAFAVRYLAGDPRAGWFTGGAGLLTTASAGLMTADTLVGLALFWTAAGLALCLLLATYWHLPAAREGVRRAAVAFLIGDLALWTAVAAATATWGRIDLRAIDPARLDGALVPVIAILVVVAALSRSAQVPFHRWLPATLAAPTPVSALLHAGVVNAGGILLIRLAPLTADGAARTLTVAAGLVTLAYGALAMLVKPDVKGALVNSTTAQMGFMIMTCGLGLWAAAVVHLVAHGLYKATLFLSSGSAITARRWHRSMPPAPGQAGRRSLVAVLVAIALPAAALGLAVAAVPPPAGDPAAAHALLIFAWATGAAASLGWLRRRPGPGGVLAAGAFLVPAALGYVLIVHVVSGFLAPELPPSGMNPQTVWLIALAAIAVLGVLAAARHAPVASPLQRAIYATTLSATHIPNPPQPTGARS